MRSRFLPRLSLLALALEISACGGATAPDRAGPPAFVKVSNGDGQSAPVASVLPNPLVVTVTDAQSRPVSGATVNWNVTVGNGVATPTSSVSDAAGTAKTQFSVGTQAGTNTVVVTSSGVTATVSFTITGTPGALSQVVASVHSLLLTCGVDTTHVSATPADQFGNPVSGTISWVSRDPTVATVDASGAVKLLNAKSSTWLVASASGATSDSVLVGSGQPVTLAAGDVDTSINTNVVCVTSNQAGSEYMLAAFYSSTTPGNSVNLTVSGTALGTIGAGADIVANRLPLPTTNLQPIVNVKTNDAFEYALRERERREMPKYVPGARAWYAQMQQQRGASLNLVPGATPSTPTTNGVVSGGAPRTQQISASAKVGDLVQLNTNANAYCNSPTFTTARIAAISNSAIVVSDTSNPAGGFTDSEYLNFAVAMDTLVMPVDTGTFGAPSDIDKNGRVVILFTKAVNALTTDPSQGIVLGFYYSRDLLPLTSSSGTCPGSNVAEMFYLLVPDPNGTVNGGNSFSKSKTNVANIVVGTIGHEFQHLINASRRMYVNFGAAPEEETWLNEGLSHAAEELIFYRASGLTPGQAIGLATLSDPQTYNYFGLYMWGNQGRYQSLMPAAETHGPIGEFAADDALPTRAATWTFLRYLADHRPTDATFFRRLDNSLTTGLDNIQQVIGTDPMPLMRQWAISMYVNGTVSGVNSTYDQLSWNWPQVFALVHGAYTHPLSHTLTSSVPVSLTLNSDGVAFFPFAVSNGQQGLLSVTGPGGISLPVGVQLTLVRTK